MNLVLGKLNVDINCRRDELIIFLFMTMTKLAIQVLLTVNAAMFAQRKCSCKFFLVLCTVQE